MSYLKLIIYWMTTCGAYHSYWSMFPLFYTSFNWFVAQQKTAYLLTFNHCQMARNSTSALRVVVMHAANQRLPTPSIAYLAMSKAFSLSCISLIHLIIYNCEMSKWLLWKAKHFDHVIWFVWLSDTCYIGIRKPFERSDIYSHRLGTTLNISLKRKTVASVCPS